MKMTEMNPRLETGRRLASLLAETEAIFQELERLRDEYRGLHELQTRSGYAAMFEKWRALSKDAHTLIRKVGDLVEPARDCCRAVDFWFPNQERPFLAAFDEDVALLYPVEVDGFESVHPFLQGLHHLLMAAAAVAAAGEPARSQPVDKVSEPERDEPRAPAPAPRSTGTAAGASLVDERQAARTLGVSVQLLRKWRAQWAKGERQGPEFVYLGKCVRYPVSGIERFLEVRSSAQGKAPAMVQ